MCVSLDLWDMESRECSIFCSLLCQTRPLGAIIRTFFLKMRERGVCFGETKVRVCLLQAVIFLDLRFCYALVLTETSSPLSGSQRVNLVLEKEWEVFMLSDV